MALGVKLTVAVAQVSPTQLEALWQKMMKSWAVTSRWSFSDQITGLSVVDDGVIPGGGCGAPVVVAPVELERSCVSTSALQVDVEFGRHR